MADDYEFDGPHSKGVAFGLWLSCVFGLCGLHRFYLGKPWSGILYFFTFGLFGIGQIVDLVRLNGMVAEENKKLAAYRALDERRILPPPQLALPPAPSVSTGDPRALRVSLTKAAASNGGKISVTQGVLATGCTFEEVEAHLDDMAKSGYVHIDNDEETGVVIYCFRELV